MRLSCTAATIGILVGASLAAPARADQIVNFDDLSGGQAVGSTYGGLNWGPNWYVATSTQLASSYGDTMGATSGQNMAYNGFGVLTVSLSDSPFTFVGANFAGWGYNNSVTSYTSTSITIEGFLNNVSVGTTSATLSASGWTWVSGSSLGTVDSLTFTSSGSAKWWLMDDFTYSSPVPEPMTLALFGAGLAGVAWRKRRKVAVA